MQQINGNSNPLGFAVIDLETTGLDILHNDRIVEIAVVLLDTNGEITETYDTLINPKRDLGPTHIHGIDGSMVVNAPVFDEIVSTLTDKLKGRKLIAHNAYGFDARFLNKEYTKAGSPISISNDYYLDTLDLARQSISGPSNYKLGTLTDFLGIDLVNAHTALDDTIATAKLFKIILLKNPAYFYRHAQEAMSYEWPDMGNKINRDWYPRSSVNLVNERSFAEVSLVEEFALHFRGLDSSREKNKKEYLDTLYKSFLGDELRESDISKLKLIVEKSYFSKEAFIVLNKQYYSAFAQSSVVKDMNYVSKSKKLKEMGHFLGLDETTIFEITHAIHSINDNLNQTNPIFSLKQGDRISLTGTMKSGTRTQWEEFLRGKGYVVGIVSKKTTVLTSNDFNSQSIKAQNARAYGTLVIDEKTLIKMVGGSPKKQNKTLAQTHYLTPNSQNTVPQYISSPVTTLSHQEVATNFANTLHHVIDSTQDASQVQPNILASPISHQQIVTSAPTQQQTVINTAILEKNKLATASFILGLGQFLFFWLIIPAPLAVIFGHMALHSIKRSPARGERLAVIGITLGYVGTSFFVFAIIMGLLFGKTT